MRSIPDTAERFMSDVHVVWTKALKISNNSRLAWNGLYLFTLSAVYKKNRISGKVENIIDIIQMKIAL